MRFELQSRVVWALNTVQSWPLRICGRPPLRCVLPPSAASPEFPSSPRPSLLGSQSPSSLWLDTSVLESHPHRVFQKYQDVSLKHRFSLTSRSRLRPSQPLPVSAVPPPAAPGPGPAPLLPAGSYGSELLHHPPPEIQKKKQQEMSWVIRHPNYPKWSLTLFPPESRKWRQNDKRTVARKGWASGG